VVQGLAYAVAYPFGIIGIILTMLVVKAVFRVDVRAEVAAAEAAQGAAGGAAGDAEFVVRNANLVGRTLGRVPGLAGTARGGVEDLAGRRRGGGGAGRRTRSCGSGIFRTRWDRKKASTACAWWWARGRRWT